MTAPVRHDHRGDGQPRRGRRSTSRRETREMNGQPAPVISVTTRKGARYPSSEGWFSPSEKYPEWHEAPVPVHNDVYGMLRELFEQAGLDADRVGSGAWNPLGAYIRPGSR